AMARGSISDFVNKATPAEAEYERQYGRGPSRFARQEHSIEVEADGRTEEIWTPDTGVVRR
ncbi:unnamed protein product, partial [marine sediment metagenome]